MDRARRATLKIDHTEGVAPVQEAMHTVRIVCDEQNAVHVQVVDDVELFAGSFVFGTRRRLLNRRSKEILWERRPVCDAWGCRWFCGSGLSVNALKDEKLAGPASC